MLQSVADTVTSDLPAITRLAFPRRAEALSREILKVLARAASDNDFIVQLTHRGSEALRGYHLTDEAKAALVSGDVGWIEARIGKLDARLSTWLQCRLQREIW